MNLLSVAEISKRKDNDFVLNEVSFNQQPCQKIAIAGETGSGKSTLLKIIAGLIQPDVGEVLFENIRVLGPDEKLLPGHPSIAYLSQHFELRNNYRVEELLSYANKLSEEEAETIYEVCRINHLVKRRTDELSGGEKQRIAMARLLISTPKLLLLDEPFSNLDMVHKNIMKEVVRDLGEKLKLTCIMISHDPLDTLSWADEIMVMKDGQVLQQGRPEEVYKKPINKYVAGLFGSYNLLTKETALSLNKLTGVEVCNGKLLIRPEGFKIVTDTGNSIEGKVTAIYFFGSYYDLDVLLEGNKVTVRSLECNYNVGDTIYVSIAPEDVYYLNF